MSRITLRTAKAACAKEANLVLTDPRLITIINEAEERLMDRGRWWGTYARTVFSVTNGTITWPQNVAAINNVTICNEPYIIQNGWYEFIEFSDGLRANSGAPIRLIDRGNVALERDISGSGKKIRAYAGHPSDSSKLVHIKGLNSLGQRIISQYPPGQPYGNEAEIDGLYLILPGWFRANNNTPLLANDGTHLSSNLTYAESDIEVSSIFAVEKELTNYPVTLREIDVATGIEIDIGVYNPSETIVTRRRSLLDPFTVPRGTDTTCTSTVKRVTAMAKLQHIDVNVDTDYLVLQSKEALVRAVKSIRLGESSEIAASEAEFKLAIKALNHQLRTMNNDQMTVDLQIHGTSKYSLRQITAMT